MLHISDNEADFIADSIYDFNDFLTRNENGENIQLSDSTRKGISLLLREGIAAKIFNTIPEIHQYSLRRNLEKVSSSKVGFDGTCAPLGTRSTFHEDGSFKVMVGVDKSNRYEHISPQDDEPIRLTLDSRGDNYDHLKIEGHIIDLLAILEKQPIRKENE